VNVAQGFCAARNSCVATLGKACEEKMKQAKNSINIRTGQLIQKT